MRRNTDLHLLFAGLSLLCGAALAAEPPPSVIVAPARQVQFADSIEALGTVAARESVALTATVTETVRALHFDDGDRVSKGHLDDIELAALEARQDEIGELAQAVTRLVVSFKAALGMLKKRQPS